MIDFATLCINRHNFHKQMDDRNTCHRRCRFKLCECNVGRMCLGVLSVIFGLLASRVESARTNDILRLNIPTILSVDPNTVCKTYPGLTPKQYELCAKYPDVTASALQGVQIGIHECKNQFQAYRWNCSSLELKNKNPQLSPILTKGYRETAFAYAISAAGVTHQVAKACSLGKLDSCGCDNSLLNMPPRKTALRNQWEWGGCSHNIEFGEKFTREFVNSRHKGIKDIRAKINRHNNKVGRMTVARHVSKKCKCHGMSGSCELKTCWKSTPDFHEVGKLLMEKYKDAKQVRVEHTNAIGGNIKSYYTVGRRNRWRRRLPSHHLVYFEKSPTFCDANKLYGSAGTTGRICNKSSSDIDNCETLCCGRGYDTVKIKRIERCNCKFHWCCYVKCDTCTHNDWITVCK